MKKFILAFCLLAAFRCPAPVNQFDLGTLPPDPWPAENARRIAARGLPPPDPWRLINGVTYYTRGDGFRYYYDRGDSTLYASFGSRSVFAAGWFVFTGKVIEVQSRGIRVRGVSNYFGTNAVETVFFVINYPYQVSENDTIGVHLAREAGTYTYDTVSGGTATLHQFDYGIVVSGPPPAIPPTAEEAQAAATALAAKKADMKARALKYDRETADHGDSYSQRRMGERYRDGDGVPKSLNAARTWFQMAVTQGDHEAARELADLP